MASVAGGLLFLMAAGGGAWWWTHRQPPAALPEPAPIAGTAPEQPAAPADTPATPPTEQEMTNDTVIEMVQAKVPLNVILSQMRTSKTNFNLTPGEVIRLTKAGVPASAIEAMRDPKKIPALAAAAPAVTTKQAQKSPPPVQTPQAAPAPPPPVQVAVAPPAPAPPPAVTETPVAPVVAPVVKPATTPVTIPNGLPFAILLTDDIPASAEEGQALQFTALNDFRVGDKIVIAKGAMVRGAIAEGAKKKLFGSSKMTLRLTEATGVAGNKIRLRATSAARPDGPPTRPVETGVKKPKDIAAERGTEYVAYIDGEQTAPGK